MYKNVMLNIPHELENMIFEYLSVSEKNYFFLDIKIMLRFRNKDVYIDRDAHRISFTSVQNSRFYYTSCDKIPCLFDVDCLKVRRNIEYKEYKENKEEDRKQNAIINRHCPPRYNFSKPVIHNDVMIIFKSRTEKNKCKGKKCCSKSVNKYIKKKFKIGKKRVSFHKNNSNTENELNINENFLEPNSISLEDNLEDIFENIVFDTKQVEYLYGSSCIPEYVKSDKYVVYKKLIQDYTFCKYSVTDAWRNYNFTDRNRHFLKLKFVFQKRYHRNISIEYLRQNGYLSMIRKVFIDTVFDNDLYLDGILGKLFQKIHKM